MYKLGYKVKFQLCGTADCSFWDLFVFFLRYDHFLFLFTYFKAADIHSIYYYSSVSTNLQNFSAALKKTKMTETDYISFL